MSLDRPTTSPETSYSTKQVFMRAGKDDEIESYPSSVEARKRDVPESWIVLQRSMMFFGPMLRIKPAGDTDGQWRLTSPSPDAEAMVWLDTDSGWAKVAEVSLEFADEPPKHDFCLKCGERLSTVAHRRRAAVGRCAREI